MTKPTGKPRGRPRGTPASNRIGPRVHTCLPADDHAALLSYAYRREISIPEALREIVGAWAATPAPPTASRSTP